MQAVSCKLGNAGECLGEPGNGVVFQGVAERAAKFQDVLKSARECFGVPRKAGKYQRA